MLGEGGKGLVVWVVTFFWESLGEVGVRAKLVFRFTRER